jgi:hypothetical protein
MKWASKVKVIAAGLLLAVASRTASANPVVRMGGPDAGINPDNLLMASQQTNGIAPFVSVLADPASAGMDDPATVAFQVSRLNSLKAWGLPGLGGVAELTACELDVMQGLSLALDGAVQSHEAMLLQAKAAQDMIAALLGVPLLGVDSLEAIDEVAASGDADSLLAALLSGELSLSDAIAQLQSTDPNDPNAVTGDTTNLLSAGGGGAWYGGSYWFGGADMGMVTNNNKHYGSNAASGASGTATHHAKHHALRAAAPADAAAVPLPPALWAGALLLAVAVAAQKKARQGLFA